MTAERLMVSNDFFESLTEFSNAIDNNCEFTESTITSNGELNYDPHMQIVCDIHDNNARRIIVDGLLGIRSNLEEYFQNL